jgi:hypothetical protein
LLGLALLERNATVAAARAGTLRIVPDATLASAMPLVDLAAATAARAEPPVRVRILEGVSDALGRFLREGRYQGLATASLRRHFARYLALQSELLFAYRMLGRSSGDTARLVNAALARTDEVAGESGRRLEEHEITPAELAVRLEESGSAFDRALRTLELREAAFPSRPARSVTVEFTQGDEVRAWSVASSVASVAAALDVATVALPSGRKGRGVRVAAPLSQVPVVKLGRTSMHAGRFFAERRFDPALDVRGLPFIDLHLHASGSVPVTIYLNRRDRLRSDVLLRAGEQVVRIDLRNYWDTKFDPGAWDGRIHDLGIDVWPQDIIYPYPQAVDTALTLFGLRATNEIPDSAALSRQGRQGWVSQFQANVPFGEDRIRALDDLASSSAASRTTREAISKEYRQRWISERFRSFTEHRILAPRLEPADSARGANRSPTRNQTRTGTVTQDTRAH